MTTSFMHTGDVHLDATTHGRTNATTGLNTLWESNFTVLSFLVEQAIAKKVNFFVDAGDLTDGGRPSQEALLLVFEAYKPLGEAGIPLVIIDGNHHVTGVPTDHRTVIHTLATMLRAVGVQVFIASKPELLRLPDGSQVAALPWLSKNRVLAMLGKDDLSPADGDRAVTDYALQTLEDLAEQADSSQPLIMTGHVTVDRLRIDAVADGHRRGSEQDMAHLFAEPVLPVARLEQMPFQYGALGHIHTPQHFGDRYYYAGSPNRLTFTDMPDHKAGNLVTLNGITPTVELVTTPARTMTRIDLADDDAQTHISNLTEGALVQVHLAEGQGSVPADVKKAIRAAGATLEDTRTRTKPRIETERVQLPKQVDPLTALRTWGATQNYNQADIDTLVSAAEKLEQ